MGAEASRAKLMVRLQTRQGVVNVHCSHNISTSTSNFQSSHAVELAAEAYMGEMRGRGL
jgi:hypothetical protein